MHYCKNCLQQVEDNILYCPNCGASQYAQGEVPVQNLKPQEHSLGTESGLRPVPMPATGLKNPWLTAILNFFLPGIGYAYAGWSKDKSMIFFGTIIFIAVFIGLYVPIFGGPPSTTPVALPEIDVLETLIFLLPFAFAYDGYSRTNKMNQSVRESASREK
jgi:hypothetical protein